MVDTVDIRQGARAQAGTMVDRLRQLVHQESPPGVVRQLHACADLLESWISPVLGRPAVRVVRDGLPHLLWPADDQRVLLLGHYDTVWPAGTTRDWPFALADGIATGPGVCDMKSGIVQLVTALSLLPDTSRVGVLLTCDEESGSPTSRPLIEQQARRSRAVLVGEPSTETGALKVARKGGSRYEITVRGRAAHAGVEPHRGVNAAVELAHQVLAVRAFATEGTSVTPTVLSAGTISNQVPESATFCVDVRAWTREELDRVDRLIHALTPRLAEAALVVGGGINRYPLQEAVALPLLRIAQRAGRMLGLPPLEAAHAAGASDANFTGSLGVATLDGLGGVGGGSHARSEWVDVTQLSDRAALLAATVAGVLTQPRRDPVAAGRGVPARL
ncbi:M20/M25/M40 family metallo-hydrolase [Micromonospora sp. NBC_01655]|uniref:M20/M25/M40 family metallo-hydrolase n=1 Tax=Micromonospora sp. NBC_01655 TaxID=2975983 RepID=UPI00224E36EC|nr:M20/M25/M40 family metallo-hydrolase [Micromonospora sp. NBC_01655]MCX4472241.1 M20/M25/M40 family metallo-hydrolase [Micromonospora sp. NBC_01655]